MTQITVRTFHGNPFMLIAGTDEPQLDPDTQQPIPDPLYGTTTEEVMTVPDPLPVDLSAVDFNAYVWDKLGGADVGMARFQEIEDDAFTHGGAAKAAARQIDRSTVFAKAQTVTLLTTIKDAGCMTAGEVTAIVDGWPEI